MRQRESALFAQIGTRSAMPMLAWALLLAVVAALALLPLPTILLSCGLSLAITLPLIDPVFGLYWAILSVPIQELTHLPGGFSYTQAAVLLAAFGWGLRTLAHPERPLVKSGLFPLWVFLLWSMLLATSLTPYSRTESIKETLRWVEAFLIWLLTINTVKHPWQIAGLVACLLLAPAAEATLGLVQFLSGDGPRSFRIAADQIFVRAYGTIGQPNSFAGYLNMAWPLALALALGTTTARGYGRGSLLVRVLLGIALWTTTLLLLAALVVSFSRGAWLGAAIGVLGMLLALGRQAARLGIGALLLGMLLIILGSMGLLPDILATRLASISRSFMFFDPYRTTVTPENFAVAERMAQLQAGWHMFIAHPLSGVGPGNYTAAYSDFTSAPWYASRGHAHNYYLHIAAELGIVGALAYLTLLAGVCRQAATALRRADTNLDKSIAIGCCGTIAAIAGHEIFENLHALSMGIQIAAVWGLLIVIAQTIPLPHSNADRFSLYK